MSPQPLISRIAVVFPDKKHQTRLKGGEMWLKWLRFGYEAANYKK
jgi:hypothetical protein